ncbi:MAG: class I SAM-dependent methyltransferase [Anaerolineae bacterium]|nr:class I SAM-dependent methyltransferase [Anaerolineae bacterium]
MHKTAFDALAADYDADFTDSAIARHLRARVWRRLEALFKPGQRVLELGCGTGEDAAFLAGRSVFVHATDASPTMRHVAAHKLARFIDVGLAQVEALDLRALPQASFGGPYDGALANFGVLNSLDSWAEIGAWLAARLRPGACVGLGVMPPYCLFELAWHGAHGEWDVALRRLRGARFQPSPNSPPLTISYPTPRRLLRALRPHFRRVRLRPLGLALPPSDVYGALERRPRLLRALLRLDDALQAPFLSALSDHYWLELVRHDKLNRQEAARVLELG